MHDEFRRYHTVLKFLIPLLLFCLFFTLDILNPTRIGWLLDGDWGQHFLGWHAFRQTPLAWPFNHENLLAHPTGLSLIYTDSNALLALPLRLLSPILPKHFQYIGLWFLACLLLHYYMAWRLVEKHAPGPWAALAGATLLSLLPTLYNRIGHDTLCAHWLILWALYIFFEIRDERRKLIAYSVALGLTGLIHPYILFMLLAIWAADQARRIVPLLKARQWRDGLVATGLAAATLVPSVVGLAMAGAFSGQSAASDGFGVYGMPLDAIFNPGRKDFLLALLNGPQDPRMQFEGFQYLGFGLLVLIGTAIWLYLKTPGIKAPADEADDVLARARPLMWPFIVLLVLAVSDNIFLYKIKLIDLSFPTPLVNVLNIVRASGRLFWPIAYTAVFLALVCVYRAPSRTRAIVLGAALGLQLVDLGTFAAHTRDLTAPAADATEFHTTPSPQWDRLMSATRMVSFEPATPQIKDHRPFYEVILHAVDRKVPINMMYAARENPVQDALERKEYFDFLAGRIDPGHLYVLLGHAVPAPLADRVRVLDGLWIIPPQAMADTGDRPQIPAFVPGTTYTFGADQPTATWLGQEWGIPQDGSIASGAPHAVIDIPYTPAPGKDLLVALQLRPWGRRQHLTIDIDGKAVATQDITKKSRDISLRVPAADIGSGPLRLGLASSAAPLPGKPAKGAVGVQVYSLSVAPAN